MKLLLITQVLDKNDPLLGFMHEWIRRLAEHCQNLTVVCLKEDRHNLPQNVQVFSLGKESGSSRMKYIFRFYKYIFAQRKNYDTIFVHMNQEYVLLGGVFWRAWGKRVNMWRNHPRGTFLTRLAICLSNKVFCVSEFSFTARFKKTEIMPAGTDTEFFLRQENIPRDKNSILCLGRISPIKKVEVLLKALAILKEKGREFVADIAGDPPLKDEIYYQGLREFCHQKGLDDSVKWIGAVNFEKTSAIYNAHEIFVNLTPTGSLDKTVPEAMACECLVLVSNRSYEGKINSEFLFKQDNAQELAQKLENLLALGLDQKTARGRNLRNFAAKNHSLNLLIEKLTVELK